VRIALLTGGGDAPGLNAAIRAVTKALIGQCGAEVVGVLDGYLGLLEQRTRPLDWDAVSGIAALGGTLLGTTNKVSPLHWQGADRCDDVVAYARDVLRVDGLVAMGGDGTMAIAAELHARGLPTVGVPKTIDNDIARVDRSFGFDTAVARVAEALERLATTGQSHGRVMILETMGRHAGWIALEGGLAGSVDAILLPEIDFDIGALAALCHAREARRRSTLICIAEGAKPRGGSLTVRDRVDDATEPERLGGVGVALQHWLQPRLTSEVRATVLGHVQRGGSPTPADRVLATLYGNAAAELVRAGGWGRLVSREGGVIGSAPLAEVGGVQRCVPLDDALVACARQIGVSFGEA
jgi:6-phosphofructokinase